MSVGARFKNRVEAMLFPLLLAILLLLSTRLSDELSGYVRQGMSLAAGVIIPSVFPFMILSDLIACTADF